MDGDLARLELVPQATPEIERAVRQAIAALAAGPARVSLTDGEWRRAALAEGVERDPGYDPEPASSRGAARA